MRQIILDTLEGVYGKSIYCPILADELAEKLPSWDKDDQREREMIRRIWDFFSGGGTAEIAAHRIKMALVEAGQW